MYNARVNDSLKRSTGFTRKSPLGRTYDDTDDTEEAKPSAASLWSGSIAAVPPDEEDCDQLQSWLDQNVQHPDRHTRIRHLMNLTRQDNKLPDALFIRGVTLDDSTTAIAGGAFADVCTGVYRGQAVAVKRFRGFLLRADHTKTYSRFCREALVWRQLRHPRILPLLGVDREAFESAKTPSLVSPWMEHGTLLDYLGVIQGISTHQLELIADIASGLQYLHSYTWTHGDLHGSNIYIDENYRALLGDFGLTAVADRAHLPPSTTLNKAGASRWLAPELFHQSDGLPPRKTLSGDIFAFGRLCLCIYTRRLPYHEISVDVGVIMKVITHSHPSKPTIEECHGTDIPDAVWELVTRCWGADPNARPSMANVIRTLENRVGTQQTMISPPPQRLQIPKLPPTFAPAQQSTSTLQQAAPEPAQTLITTQPRQPSSPETLPPPPVWPTPSPPSVSALPFRANPIHRPPSYEAPPALRWNEPYNGHTPLRNPLPEPPRDVFDDPRYAAFRDQQWETEAPLSRSSSDSPGPSPTPFHGGLGTPLNPAPLPPDGINPKTGLPQNFIPTGPRSASPSPSAAFSRRERRENEWIRSTRDWYGPTSPQVRPSQRLSSPLLAASPMAHPISAPSQHGGARPPSMPFSSHVFPHMMRLAFDSDHPMMYGDQVWPTAAHLLESMKFTPTESGPELFPEDRAQLPELREAVRGCKTVEDMQDFVAGASDWVRSDWAEVAPHKADEVLWYKLNQYRELRGLLNGTGDHELLYVEPNDLFWGAADAGGWNELGKALMRARDTFREGSEVGRRY